MKMLAFASRNAREMLRDRLNLVFGIGFPVILLLLLTTIQRNIPVSLFELDMLTPGVAIFGLSFIALFSALLIAKDRSSAFMLRILASPMTAADAICGYALPLLPMAIAQVTMCYLVAFLLGLSPTWNVVWAILSAIPAALVFIGLGLLFGSIFPEKAVGGICGALLTNLTAWLSGTWFDIHLVGGGFAAVANALPFLHAVNAGRTLMYGSTENLLSDMLWVSGYALLLLVLAVIAFTRKAYSDSVQ